MTFRITGPGFYVNRRGEKVDITSRTANSRDYSHYKWVAQNNIPAYCYKDCGRTDLYGSASDEDVVGVWEESIAHQVSKLGIDQHTSEYVYDLTKVSERFRALEDGRTLLCIGSTMSIGYTPEDAKADSIAGFIATADKKWSLVPETKRAVTKLWVYTRDGSDINTWTQRSELPTGVIRCLGAIEGSELTEEVDA